MGYSITWTAVRGKQPEAILDALGLVRTGRTTDDNVTSRRPFACCDLEGGWFLVLADAGAAGGRFMEDAGGDAFLAELSAGCEVVACFVEEHVMVSRAAAWKDGALLWTVLHDAQVGLDHLERTGAPPPGAETAEAEARRQLRDDPDPADFLFDVPVAFASALVPYRYDEGDHVYEELERVAARERPRSVRSFLARLLGR